MLTFTLTIEEANLITTALGKLPYEAVEAIILKLRTQAAPQLETKKKE